MRERFIVPQFITSEDKILGPITVRQFIIMIVGGLLIFAASKLADFALFILETVVIASLVGLFSFVKVNGAPFHVFLLNFIEALKKPRIRIWRKEDIRIEEHKNVDEDKPSGLVERKVFLPNSKLSELSLIVDTGGIYKGEQEANRLNKTLYNNANYETR